MFGTSYPCVSEDLRYICRVKDIGRNTTSQVGDFDLRNRTINHFSYHRAG